MAADSPITVTLTVEEWDAIADMLIRARPRSSREVGAVVHLVSAMIAGGLVLLKREKW